MDSNIIEAIANDPNFKLLKKVPENFTNQILNNDEPNFVAAIIDLETMGLNSDKDEIIEIGVIWFYFNKDQGILGIKETYNGLQEPSSSIPAEITKITGITDEDVKGQAIDWLHINELLKQTHLVICHNSQFDRNFLECQTPLEIKNTITKMAFACTIKDINWQQRGFESSKLDYLNFKLGYFYDGHRALNDCYATFNLLTNELGVFEELKANVRKKETLIVAQNAPFDKKDLLKQKKYRWSDGQGALPKAWWATLPTELLADEIAWLDERVYGRNGVAENLPQSEITARKRYSNRALKI